MQTGLNGKNIYLSVGLLLILVLFFITIIIITSIIIIIIINNINIIIITLSSSYTCSYEAHGQIYFMFYFCGQVKSLCGTQ